MTQHSNLDKLSKLIETVHQLRAPGGCPWDREQTHLSLRPYLIEEAYEVLEVIDQIKDEKSLQENESLKNSFREELGDLLMQVVLHSELTAESGAFDFYDVAEELDKKLIRRHPHVFGNQKVDDASAAYDSWQTQKTKEKKSDESLLSSVPKGLPTLQRTAKIIERVTKVGFQWDSMEGPLDKLQEEVQELSDEVRSWEKNESSLTKERIESELGDVLFCLCNLAYLFKINPEDALRGTLRRFEERFSHIENRVKEKGKSLEETSLEEMDQYWNEAKGK